MNSPAMNPEIRYTASPRTNPVNKRSKDHSRLDTFTTWMALVLETLLTIPQETYRNLLVLEDAIVSAAIKDCARWATFALP